MRHTPLQRRIPLRRTGNLPSVSKQAPTHRLAYRPSQYTKFRARLLARWGWRCAVCHKATVLEVHHVQKRSQLGPDTDTNCLPLCTPFGGDGCHARADQVFDQGRLVIKALGRARFRWAVIVKANKWAATPPDVQWTETAPTED